MRVKLLKDEVETETDAEENVEQMYKSLIKETEEKCKVYEAMALQSKNDVSLYVPICIRVAYTAYEYLNSEVHSKI